MIQMVENVGVSSQKTDLETFDDLCLAAFNNNSL